MSSLARPRVLYVTHNLAGRQPFGGVEIYQKVVKDELRPDFDIWTLVRNVDGDHRVFELHDAEERLVDTFTLSRAVDEGMLRGVESETMFTMALRRYGFSLVHFQHMIGFVPTLAHLAQALGIRTAFTAHDYYAVCSNYNLIDHQGRPCVDTMLRLGQCDSCLFQQRGIPYGAQRLRRNAYAEMLRHIDLTLFPSRAAHDIVAAVYPDAVARSRFVVLGQPMVIKDWPVRRPAGPALPLKIAVYGNFSFNKGADVLLDTFRQMRGVPVEFHLFGRIDSPYDALLNAEGFANVVNHGPFPAGQPPEALGDCHCSVHFSNWPETFCMTLSEAWQFGLVPIVTDIGALGERVEDGVTGFKVPPNDVASVITLLRRLTDDPTVLETVRSNIGPHLTMTPAEHAAEIAAHYRAILPMDALEAPEAEFDRPDLCKVATLDHLGLGFLPERWWTPPSAHPSPIAALVTATVDGRIKGRIGKFFDFARRYGFGYAMSQSWLFLRIRMRSLSNRGVRFRR